MRFNRIYRWIFLGHLLLCLNVVPSLHRVHWFGLHTACVAVDDAGSGSIAKPGDCNAGCCGCMATEATPDPSDNEERAADESLPDSCIVCQFFGDYHAVVFSFDLEFIDSPVFGEALTDESTSISAHLVPSARGPPLAA